MLPTPTISPASQPFAACVRVAGNTIVALSGTQHSWHLKGVTERHLKPHRSQQHVTCGPERGDAQPSSPGLKLILSPDFSWTTLHPSLASLCAGLAMTRANQKPEITSPLLIGQHQPTMCRPTRCTAAFKTIPAKYQRSCCRVRGTPQSRHTIGCTKL